MLDDLELSGPRASTARRPPSRRGNWLQMQGMSFLVQVAAHAARRVAAAPAPYHPELVSREFDRRVERWALPRLTLHGLRHTWATLALRAGVHPKVVQERLEHSTIGVTLNTYSHVTMGMQRDAAEQVAGLIFGS